MGLYKPKEEKIDDDSSDDGISLKKNEPIRKGHLAAAAKKKRNDSKDPLRIYDERERETLVKKEQETRTKDE